MENNNRDKKDKIILNNKKMKIFGFHGYNIKFSPKNPRLICVGGANYGLQGRGSIYIIDIVESSTLKIVQNISNVSDVITDVSWCPSQPAVDAFVTGCGRGILKVYNGDKLAVSVVHIQAHTAEIASIEWGPEGTILSCGWDGTFKIWDDEKLANTFTSPDLQGLCFEAKMGHNGLIATALSNSQMQLWDRRGASGKPCLSANHGSEVTSVEWHRSDINKICSGASDSVIRLWDMRNTCQPMLRLLGHDYAVRKIVTCKFNPDVLLSCSYDKTVRRWHLQNQSRLLNKHEKLEHHSEFVYGLDTSPMLPGMAVDCSWDSEIKLFRYH